MERLKEMVIELEDMIENTLLKRQEQLMNVNQKQKDQVAQKLKEICLIQPDNEELSIVITWLRSSSITGSHQFKIALYDKVPFVDEDPEIVRCNLKDFFCFVQQDILAFKRQLQGRLIHVLNGEIETLRRYYMERLYQDSKPFFEMIIKDLDPLREPKMKVYFGEEMGDIDLIGMI